MDIITASDLHSLVAVNAESLCFYLYADARQRS